MNWRNWIRVAKKVVPIVAGAAEGATTLIEARERLARRATAGDLDDALTITDSTLKVVEDYVDNG